MQNTTIGNNEKQREIIEKKLTCTAKENQQNIKNRQNIESAGIPKNIEK